ncbi:MoaD/ThiS family protein [Chloroflexi bacterium TSY]|nr:MoaD/ThiS family protein [Chloroflexi bacterium TSY]
MNINVRFSGDLARIVGQPRIGVALNQAATVHDLFQTLCSNYPDLESQLQSAIPVINGRHAREEEALSAGQEVAILLPIAGGESSDRSGKVDLYLDSGCPVSDR